MDTTEAMKRAAAPAMYDAIEGFLATLDDTPTHVRLTAGLEGQVWRLREVLCAAGSEQAARDTMGTVGVDPGAGDDGDEDSGVAGGDAPSIPSEGSSQPSGEHPPGSTPRLVTTNDDNAFLRPGDQLAQAPSGRLYIIRTHGVNSVSVLSTYGYPLIGFSNRQAARDWVRDEEIRRKQYAQQQAEDGMEGDK